LILIWGVIALTNGDPIWFLSSFPTQAEELIIYWDGTVTTLKMDDPGFTEISRAFADAISKPVAFEGTVGFSEENIKNYKDQYKLLEISYPQPIQVHTRYPFTKSSTYLVPLDKTHAMTRRIFPFPGYLPYTSGPINAAEAAFNNLYKAVEQAAILQ
jgi:hypothetical protein